MADPNILAPIKQITVEHPDEAPVRERDFWSGWGAGIELGLKETTWSLGFDTLAMERAKKQGDGAGVAYEDWNSSHPMWMEDVEWSPYLTYNSLTRMSDIRSLQRNLEQVKEKTVGGIGVGAFLGTLGGVMLDPVNLIPVPGLFGIKLASTFGTVATRAIYMGATNAAIEAGIGYDLGPTGYEARGLEFDPDGNIFLWGGKHYWTNVGFAAAAGVALYGLGAGTKGMWRALRGQNHGPDVKIEPSLQDKSIGNDIPDPQTTRNLRAEELLARGLISEDVGATRGTFFLKDRTLGDIEGTLVVKSNGRVVASETGRIDTTEFLIKNQDDTSLVISRENGILVIVGKDASLFKLYKTIHERNSLKDYPVQFIDKQTGKVLDFKNSQAFLDDIALRYKSEKLTKQILKDTPDEDYSSYKIKGQDANTELRKDTTDGTWSFWKRDTKTGNWIRQNDPESAAIDRLVRKRNGLLKKTKETIIEDDATDLSSAHTKKVIQKVDDPDTPVDELLLTDEQRQTRRSTDKMVYDGLKDMLDVDLERLGFRRNNKLQTIEEVGQPSKLDDFDIEKRDYIKKMLKRQEIKKKDLSWFEKYILCKGGRL